MMKKVTFILCCLLIGHSKANAQQLETSTIATNLDTPWEILWGPDDYIWITERYGRVSKVNPVSGKVTPLVTIPGVHEQSESGLLGLTLHPAFPDRPHVFMAYNYPEGSSIQERIVRYTYRPDTLVKPDTLIEGILGNGNHNGCRMVITEGRKLLFSTGDARNASAAQDDNSLSGKFLRINLDGSGPQNNPVPNSYVYSKGHRNPQGLVIAPDGTIYSSEHGPQTDDELNIIRKGHNYGWPDVKGFCDSPQEQPFCNNQNVTEPLVAWTPTLAVCGLDFYDKSTIGKWQNSLLMVTLKGDHLRHMPLTNSGDSIIAQNEYFKNDFGRLRDIAISPAGDVYLATSNRDGRANEGFPVNDDDRIIRVSVPTGTGKQNHTTSQLRLFPNPAADQMHISFQPDNNPVSITWLDMQGRIIETRPVTSPTEKFARSSFESGIYLLRVKGEGWQETKKVIWR